MKKVIINISENTYEKLRFEAIEEKKNISELLYERIFFKPFSPEVEEAFESWMNQQIEKICEEK